MASQLQRCPGCAVVATPEAEHLDSCPYQGRAALPLAQCWQPGCPLPVANDGAWHPDEEQVLCARHRQLARLRAGLCPNCGNTVKDQPIINSLTGRPRTQGSVPLTARTCTSIGCGYVQRPQRGK